MCVCVDVIWSGEGTAMVDKWLRRSEEREEKAVQWSLEESNRRVREEGEEASYGGPERRDGDFGIRFKRMR